MSTTTSQSPLVVAALNQARATGRPVLIPGAAGLAAYPNGSVTTPAGGFGGTPSVAPTTLQTNMLQTPPAVTGTLARSGGLPAGVAPAVAPSYPSSNVAGVQGAPGSPSGPAVMPPASTPPAATPTPTVDDYGRVVPTVTVPPLMVSCMQEVM